MLPARGAAASHSPAGTVRCSSPNASASAASSTRPVNTRSLARARPIRGGEPGRAHRDAQPGTGPRQFQVVAAHPQVAAGDDLCPGAYAVADAHGDRRHRKALDELVQPGESAHAGQPAAVVEDLVDVSAGAEGAQVGRRQDERPNACIGGELLECRGERAQGGRVERIAFARTVQSHDLHAAGPLANDGDVDVGMVHAGSPPHR